MAESWFQRELLTPRRLVFNAIFYGLQLFFFAYGWFAQETNTKLSGLNALKFSVWISRGAGLVLAFDGGLILVPMLRNIIRVVRPKLAWLFPADENIWFHRQVAYSMAFWAMVHTTAHYVNFINVERTHRDSRGNGPANPLHAGWWYHRALHVTDNALDLYDGKP
jgi:NADPH oxidase